MTTTPRTAKTKTFPTRGTRSALEPVPVVSPFQGLRSLVLLGALAIGMLIADLVMSHVGPTHEKPGATDHGRLRSDMMKLH